VRIKQNRFGLAVVVFTERSANFQDSEAFTERRLNKCFPVYFISSDQFLAANTTTGDRPKLAVTILVIARKRLILGSFTLLNQLLKQKYCQKKKMHKRYQRIPDLWSMPV